MKIRGFRYVVIITITQFSFLPRIDVLDRRKISRARRIIDGIEINLFHGNLLTRTVLVHIILSYKHHVNNSIPDVMQFGPEQPIVVQN